jgi:hypothetical protein
VLHKKPQKVRDWYPKHGVQSDATEHPDGTWTIGAVRNFTYRRDGSAREEWVQHVLVRVPAIVRLWYLVEPFTNSDTIAHPYFIFEYQDAETICCTIEGKRPNGTPYSGLKGVLNEYELGYVWITDLDCLTMPLTHDAKALYLYPLTLSSKETQRVCHEFLRDTHQLYEHPEFYHTLCNNCTGRFAQILRRARIRAPWDLSWYLPGWSDRYLARLGLIDASLGLRTPARNFVARSEEVWEIIDRSKSPMKEVFSIISSR